MKPDKGLRIAVVANPKPSAGADRRLESIQQLAEWCGAEITTIRPNLRPRITGMASTLVAAVNGRVVPEALAWDVPAVRAQLDLVRPELVIYQTARAFHPTLLGPWRPVLDYVDSLSLSYAQRAKLSAQPAAAALTALAASHRRFETKHRPKSVVTLAAGCRGARMLNATWIPNLAQPLGAPNPPAPAPYDAVFFGTLSYPPNVEALRWLGRLAPHLNGLRILVAGRTPTAEVLNLAKSSGWTLVEDFPSLGWLAEQAHVSLAPLHSTAGIQNKIIDAGVLGMPQVATTAALAGFDQTTLPLDGHDDPIDFANEVKRLLDHPRQARQSADRLRRHLLRDLGLEVVGPRFANAVGLALQAQGRRPMMS